MTAEAHYWCGHVQLQLQRHMDALVHFEVATMILEQLRVTSFFHQAPLLVEYADCLLQLANVLDQSEGPEERDEATRVTNSMVEQMLQDDEQLRARVDAAVRGDKQQLALTMLNAVKLTCQDATALDPAPRNIRAVLKCAELCLALGETQEYDRLLVTAIQLTAAMRVVLGDSSVDEEGEGSDNSADEDDNNQSNTIANGDPRVYLELATRLLRDSDDLGEAMRFAKRAHHLLGQLSGPDNRFTQEAERLVEQIAIEQVLPPLLALGFRHELCVEAVRVSSLDVEAAKLLLKNPEQLHAAIAESAFARTDPERLTWVLAMRTYFPGSFHMVQSVLGQIASRPEEPPFRTVRLASPEAHTHIAQVKEASQLLKAVGFERCTLENEGGQAALVLDSPHLPVLQQALVELEEVAALPIHEARIRLIYRMYVTCLLA